jgi:hypothetical protein
MLNKLLGTCLVLGLFWGTAGCAAMVRTWQFSSNDVVVVPPTATPPENRIEIRLRSARVRQKTVYVTLAVANLGSQPASVNAGAFSMRLPDGTTLSGDAPVLNQALSLGKSLLAAVGIGGGPQGPYLHPGATLEMEVEFRAVRRDLRRLPVLDLGVDAITINGQPCTDQHLFLQAPERAPKGENI